MEAGRWDAAIGSFTNGMREAALQGRPTGQDAQARLCCQFCHLQKSSMLRTCPPDAPAAMHHPGQELAMLVPAQTDISPLLFLMVFAVASSGIAGIETITASMH